MSTIPIIEFRESKTTPFAEAGQSCAISAEVLEAVIRENVTDRPLIWVSRKDGEVGHCLEIDCKDGAFEAKTSYYIGLDWLKENVCAVRVHSKMDVSGSEHQEEREVDCVRMLLEALNEPENAEHLEGLLTIRFDKPSIPVEQKQDLLTPFLICEYLQILKKIVRKGLKKSFYPVENNLQNKVKGKILTGPTIQKNLSRGHITDNVCRYQVHDVDSEENRILKKAFLFCKRYLDEQPNIGNLATQTLGEKVRYIKPAFDAVSDHVAVSAIKHFKSNPVFKDYHHAVKIAQLILRRYAYNINKVGDTQLDTPPYWIDMSKLFELYVYRRLKQVFSGYREIRYHQTFNRQEPDYLLMPKEDSCWEPHVIDAKYKDCYQTSSISIEDARQVCGYARLKKIYQEFDLNEDKAPPIKCLIVYPDQTQEEQFTFTQNEEPNFEKDPNYIRLYKVGIRLPEIPRQK